jgi:hypothetical protein
MSGLFDDPILANSGRQCPEPDKGQAANQRIGRRFTGIVRAPKKGLLRPR